MGKEGGGNALTMANQLIKPAQRFSSFQIINRPESVRIVDVFKVVWKHRLAAVVIEMFQ